ncbi:hypothetical protein [Lactobacillus johnsonii] [Lactiplantibacillus mudanjiangensis]|uniref:SIR2 family protein n=1 Tax=Lactiplantibacillus mudanjiangensis TaxID=1296538 RepID=UPI0010147F80|nr:hypothetical protein [Lactobacillus johnsonii] [Lactiplantibacillus mudanjiangensis]
MATTIKNTLKKLTTALDNSRLVIFVGAGVSKNSNLPDWYKLVKDMSNALNMPDSITLTSEDLLKIPEILFQKSPQRYQSILKKSLQTNAKPNDIDNLILKIQPHHIITTNYDQLLEKVTDPLHSIQNYAVISDDRSFIKQSNSSSQFLIKMHGDINNLSSIVLKESDYLNYDNTHVLISTFIRSLLATHTFLFVGYSLRDNNLKLIMSWINYIQNKLQDTKKINTSSNVLLYSSIGDEYAFSHEQAYYHSNNVNLVNLDSLPDNIMQYDNDNNLSNPVAKQIFAFLSALYHREAYQDSSNLPLFFKRQNYISFTDLSNILSPNETLIFSKNSVLVSEKLFHQLIRFRQHSESTILVNRIMDKTQISRLSYKINQEQFYTANINKHHILDPVFHDIITNNFIHLNTLKTIDSTDTAYVHYILKKDDAYKILKNRRVSKKDDYITFMINNLNIKFTSSKFISLSFDNQSPIQKAATKTLRNIINADLLQLGINNSSITSLLKTQEQQYKGLAFSYTVDYKSEYGYLDSIRSLAYDFYKYSRKNRLFTDYFWGRWDKLYAPYLKAAFLTYSTSIKDYSHMRTLKRKYPFNDFDIDLMTKFVASDSLANLFADLNIKKINFASDYRVVKNFSNLLHSYSSLKIFELLGPIQNYLILFLHANISEEALLTVFREIFDLEGIPFMLRIDLTNLVNQQFNNHKSSFTEVQKYLLYKISKHNTFTQLDTEFNHLSNNVRLKINKYYQHKNPFIILSEYKKYSNDENYFFFFTSILTKENIKPAVIKKYVHTLVIKYPGRALDLFLTEDSIKFKKYFFHTLIDILDNNRYQPGSLHIPDLQSERINCLAYLIGTGYRYQKKTIKPIADLDPILLFLFDPTTFDYTLVDLKNVNWQLLLLQRSNNSLKFKRILAHHKKEILSSNRYIQNMTNSAYLHLAARLNLI